MKEVQAELVKVIWPTPQEVWRFTLIVVLFSLMIGIFIGALDFIFVSITNLFVNIHG